jgi:uncharacterized membrane protein
VFRCCRAILTALILSVITVSAGAQAAPGRSTCSLQVRVTDEDGKPLPKAFVFVHDERGTNQQSTPDHAGQVKLSLRSGLYDLFISAIGFLPQAQIIDVRTCKPATINITLSIDSEHADKEGL